MVQRPEPLRERRQGQYVACPVTKDLAPWVCAILAKSGHEFMHTGFTEQSTREAVTHGYDPEDHVLIGVLEGHEDCLEQILKIAGKVAPAMDAAARLSQLALEAEEGEED